MVTCFDATLFDPTLFDTCTATAAVVVQEAIGSGGSKYKLSYRQRRKLRFRRRAIAELQHILEERQRGRAFIQFTLSAKSLAYLPIAQRVQTKSHAKLNILHKLTASTIQSMFVKHKLQIKQKITPEFENIRYLLFKLKQKLEDL